MLSQQIDLQEEISFSIDNCIYQNSLPKYLIAKTKLGDCILICINSRFDEFKPSESDVFIEKRDSITLIKEEIKMEVLQCIDHGIFGCAFINENGLCVTQKKNQHEFIEENFIFTSTLSIGKSGIYPLVSLSDVNEKRIAAVSEAIAKISFIRLRSYNKSLEDAIIFLMEQNKNLARVSSEVERDLNADIRKLTEIYERSPSITTQNALINKKELRTQFLNSLSNGYRITGMCHLISAELSKETALINKY